ncbi:MAG: flavoprotein [Deltaproteobacteria bacterium]|nr:flavoprotein [Deltaproteobacteria bacterium]
MAEGEKKILLIVTGGIAAYKTPGLVGALRAGGAEVRCAMTHNATHFIGAASLEAASGSPVLLDLFAADEQGIDHVSWGQWADLLLVAPATANFLAKMAHGLADDAASTMALATRAPVLVAPAMNDAMWAHPATVANLALLKERGATLVGPEEGELAEGYSAVGRMSEPEVIARAAVTLLA